MTTYRDSTRLVKSTSGQCIILLRSVFGLMVKKERFVTFSIYSRSGIHIRYFLLSVLDEMGCTRY